MQPQSNSYQSPPSLSSSFDDEASLDALQSKIKTVMIKHVPRPYTQLALLSEVERMVGKGTFDFFYVPWDVKRNSNCGCVFVNFLTHKAAAKCEKLFNGYKFPYSNSIKACKVVPAHVQGLQQNLKHFCDRARGLTNNVHNPLVFIDGVPTELKYEEHLAGFADQVDDLFQEVPRDVMPSKPKHLLSEDRTTCASGMSCYSLDLDYANQQLGPGYCTEQDLRYVRSHLEADPPYYHGLDFASSAEVSNDECIFETEECGIFETEEVPSSVNVPFSQIDVDLMNKFHQKFGRDLGSL